LLLMLAPCPSWRPFYV